MPGSDLCYCMLRNGHHCKRCTGRPMNGSLICIPGNLKKSKFGNLDQDKADRHHFEVSDLARMQSSGLGQLHLSYMCGSLNHRRGIAGHPNLASLLLGRPGCSSGPLGQV